MKYKAMAYIGVYELYNLGLFDTEEDAFEALKSELEHQIVDEDPKDHDAIEEAFWFDSLILPVQE